MNKRILRLQDERDKLRALEAKSAPRAPSAAPTSSSTASSNPAPEATTSTNGVDGDSAAAANNSAGAGAGASAGVTANEEELNRVRALNAAIAAAALKNSKKGQADLENVLQELDKLFADRQQLMTAAQTEEERKSSVMGWMAEVLRLLVPSPNNEQELQNAFSGAPISPYTNSSSPTSPTSESALSYPAAMQILRVQLTQLLPPGMQALQRKAQELGILQIEDVAIVLDAFRWMSWCHLTLHLLRFPAPTPLLKRLINSRPAKLCDEKILRHLTYILSKAQTWKSKARKVLQSNRKIDETKLRALVLEANNLPFSSRLKAHMQQALRALETHTSHHHASNALQRVPSSGTESSDDDCEPSGYPLPYPADAETKLAPLPQANWPLFSSGDTRANSNSAANALAALHSSNSA